MPPRRPRRRPRRAAGARRTLAGVVLAALVALLAAGCGQSELSEAEVEARAGEIIALVRSAADDVPRKQDDTIRSQAHKIAVGFDDPWHYWVAHVDISLDARSPTSPADVQQEIARALLADGWTESDPNLGSLNIGERGFHLGGGRERSWSVRVWAAPTPPPMAQAVRVSIVGPRFDH